MMSNRVDGQMDCSEAEHLIIRGETESPQLREHLGQCPACAALAGDGGGLGALLAEHRTSAADSLAGDLLDAIEDDLGRERRLRGRPHSLATPARVALALSAGLLVVGMGLLKLRPDLGVYPLLRFMAQAGIAAIAGVTAGWIWLRPLHRPPLPAWVPPLVVFAAVIIPWGLAALPAAHLAHPASLAGTGDDLVQRAAACFLFGALLGLPLALFVALLGRGARGRIVLAVLPPAAGGLCGLLALDLHCPLTSPVHLVAGHAPIVLVLVLTGAGLSLLARRRSSRRAPR